MRSLPGSWGRLGRMAKSGGLFFSQILLAVVLYGGVAYANSIYIAQSATGSNNGSSCANAYAYTFFNSAGNWGSGSNQIGPGTTFTFAG